MVRKVAPLSEGLLDAFLRGEAVHVVVRCPEESFVVLGLLQLLLDVLHILIKIGYKVLSVNLVFL